MDLYEGFEAYNTYLAILISPFLVPAGSCHLINFDQLLSFLSWRARELKIRLNYALQLNPHRNIARLSSFNSRKKLCNALFC